MLFETGTIFSTAGFLEVVLGDTGCLETADKNVDNFLTGRALAFRLPVSGSLMYLSMTQNEGKITDSYL